MKQALYFLMLMSLFYSIFTNSGSVNVTAEIAVGELIDKITILRIKSARITDQVKLINIHAELESLENTLNIHVTKSKKLEALTNELQKVNEELWDIEDAIREEERHQRFGAEFIKLARAVYFTNDRRCEIKRQINMVAGSRFIEEKSYTDYRTTAK